MVNGLITPAGSELQRPEIRAAYLEGGRLHGVDCGKMRRRDGGSARNLPMTSRQNQPTMAPIYQPGLPGLPVATTREDHP